LLGEKRTEQRFSMFGRIAALSSPLLLFIKKSYLFGVFQANSDYRFVSMPNVQNLRLESSESKRCFVSKNRGVAPAGISRLLRQLHNFNPER
jgi:hypothetical protein